MTSYTLPHRLKTQDACFLYDESETGPLHFGGLAFFEDDFDFDFQQLLDHVGSLLHLLPRFRQRLVFAPFNLAHPALYDDPDFRIENHLFSHKLAAGTSDEQLTETALRIFEPPLDRCRPLWEMHLFQGLESGRSAILFKVHHCIVDGLAWVNVLSTLFNFEREPAAAVAAPEWKPEPIAGTARLLGEAVLDLVEIEFNSARKLLKHMLPDNEKREDGGVLAGAAELFRALRPAAAAPWNRGLVDQKRSFTWMRYAFNDVRAIRRAFGGTVNDVVLAALGEGAARYLKFHGGKTYGLPLRIGCPVSVRDPAETESLGNRVSMMFAEIESEPAHPVARLKSLSNETRRIKSANKPKALEQVITATDLVPPALTSFACIFGAGVVASAAGLCETAQWVGRTIAPWFPPINFIATNVRGPQIPAYLAGHRMLDYLGMVPLAVDLGYGVVISTYNRNLYLAFMAAPNLMPDVELMKAFVDDAFQELELAAREVASPGGRATLGSQPREASLLNGTTSKVSIAD